MMLVAKVFFTLLEVLFFSGMVGSAIVVILTSIEDFKEISERAEPESGPRVTELRHSGSEAH